MPLTVCCSFYSLFFFFSCCCCYFISLYCTFFARNKINICPAAREDLLKKIILNKIKWDRECTGDSIVASCVGEGVYTGIKGAEACGNVLCALFRRKSNYTVHCMCLCVFMACKYVAKCLHMCSVWQSIASKFNKSRQKMRTDTCKWALRERRAVHNEI